MTIANPPPPPTPTPTPTVVPTDFPEDGSGMAADVPMLRTDDEGRENAVRPVATVPFLFSISVEGDADVGSDEGDADVGSDEGGNSLKSSLTVAPRRGCCRHASCSAAASEHHQPVHRRTSAAWFPNLHFPSAFECSTVSRQAAQSLK